MNITTVKEFQALTDEQKYIKLHNTEFLVCRLKRIARDLNAWRDGSNYYQDAVKELEEVLKIKRVKGGGKCMEKWFKI